MLLLRLKTLQANSFYLLPFTSRTFIHIHTIINLLTLANTVSSTVTSKFKIAANKRTIPTINAFITWRFKIEVH